MPKIFVSATTKDLEAFRLHVANRLLKAEIEPIYTGDFPVTDLYLVEKLATSVRACDAMIALIGFAFGEPARRAQEWEFPSCSCTQFEVLYAERLGMPIFYWIAEDHLRVQRGWLADERQLEFRRRIENNGRDRPSFGSKVELDGYVDNVLAAEPWRKSVWRSAGVAANPARDPLRAVGLVVVPDEERVLGCAFSVVDRLWLATTGRVAMEAELVLREQERVEVWWHQDWNERVISEIEVSQRRPSGDGLGVVGRLRVCKEEPAACDLPLSMRGPTEIGAGCRLLRPTLATKSLQQRIGVRVEAREVAPDFCGLMAEGLDGAPILDEDGRVVAMCECAKLDRWTALEVGQWRGAFSL